VKSPFSASKAECPCFYSSFLPAETGQAHECEFA
jgi:hypothetical protein